MRSGLIWWAFAAAIFAGLCGVAPHVAFSIDQGEQSWFVNSFDEGYYGWTAFDRPISHRLLGGGVLKALALVTRGDLDLAMTAADFVLPFLTVMAACFAVSTIFRSGPGVVAGGWLLVLAAEMLAFRSIYSPTFIAYPWIEMVLRWVDPTGAGIFPQGNFTSVFWLYRTPEPQATWTVAFLLLGSLLRLVETGQARWLVVYSASCLAGSTGYLLAIFPILGAASFAGMGLWFLDRRMGVRVFVPAITGGVLVFALALLSAEEGASGSLVFASRIPVFLFTGVFGGVIAGVVAAVSLRRGSCSRMLLLAGLLAMAPLLMANQQVLTGRMIYLFNFENFAFAQIVAFAGLLLVPAWRGVAPDPAGARSRWGVGCAVVMVLFFGGSLVKSQMNGYRDNLAFNRNVAHYADIVGALDINRGDRLLCDDIFVAGNLAILLGWRPNFVLSRDLTFDRLMDRLDGPGSIPEQRADLQPRLFEALALSGMTVEEFGLAFDAVCDPTNPDWQSRFLVGGLLYNPADFWEPLTHGRSLRLDWIAEERPILVGEYAEFLESKDWLKSPVIAVGAWTSDEVKRLRRSFKIRRLAEAAGSGVPPVRAVLVKSWRGPEDTE